MELRTLLPNFVSYLSRLRSLLEIVEVDPEIMRIRP